MTMISILARVDIDLFWKITTAIITSDIIIWNGIYGFLMMDSSPNFREIVSGLVIGF